MASVGQALTASEAGWRRYDDTDSRIKYSSNVSVINLPGYAYKDNVKDLSQLNDSCYFKFHGTKLRIIGVYDPANQSDNIAVDIDGTVEFFSERKSPWAGYIIVYEKQGLSLGDHIVKLKNLATIPTPLYNFIFDAIDIDATGYLLHPTLTQKSTVDSMSVGDCIPCRYIATTANVAGTFSELGTCIADEIPITGSTTPNGLFYFIKSDKGLLIADRVIQNSISWDVLNAAKYVQGSTFDSVLTPLNMTGYTTPSPYVVSCSSVYGSDFGWRAFDNDTDTRPFWFTIGTLTGGQWVKIYLGSKTKVSSFGLSSLISSGSSCSIKDWILWGSNDDVTYTQVLSSTQPNSPAHIQYSFNTVEYSYFRLNILNSYVSDHAGVTKMTLGDSSKSYKIRSLTGGNSYLGTDGKSSLVDKNLRCFPMNNEFDKYILKSSLGEKIIPGDNSIWHHNTFYSICKDTPINGNYIAVDGSIGVGNSTTRIWRGYNDTTWKDFALVPNSPGTWSRGGFRPVLEYPDDDKCTSL